MHWRDLAQEMRARTLRDVEAYLFERSRVYLSEQRFTDDALVSDVTTELVERYLGSLRARDGVNRAATWSSRAWSRPASTSDRQRPLHWATSDPAMSEVPPPDDESRWRLMTT